MEAVLAFFRRVWTSLKEYWQSQERKAKMRFIVISGIAFVAIIVALYYLTRVNYTVLLDQDVPTEERAAAYEALREAGFRVRASDGQLLVESSRADDAVLEMSNRAVLTEGYNYETLMRSSGFAVSSAERENWKLMYIQETLSRELAENNPKIRQARVQIAQPNNGNALYGSEILAVTASVKLTLIEPLTPDEVAGVANYVAFAYPGLDVNNIVVNDQSLNMLNRNEPTDATRLIEQRDYELAFQEQSNRALLQQFLPIFGASHVSVSTYVKVDFDEKTSEAITFTPPNEEDMEGLMVSQRSLSESATGSTPYTAGEPGIDENGWDAIYPEAGDNATSSWKSNTLEANYEINQLAESIKEAQGDITRLTATITVDSLPFDEKDMQLPDDRDIRTIAAGVLGLTARDTELINVVFQPFNGVLDEEARIQKYEDALRWRETMALIRVLALYLIIGICVVLLITRVYKFLRPPTPEDDLLDMPLTDTDEIDEYANLLKLTTEPEDIETTKSPERMKLEDFIDRNPDMVANLLRNWLTDETPRGRH